MRKRNPNRCRVISRPADPPRPTPLEAIIEEVSGGKYKVVPWNIRGLDVLVVVKKEEDDAKQGDDHRPPGP